MPGGRHRKDSKTSKDLKRQESSDGSGAGVHTESSSDTSSIEGAHGGCGSGVPVSEKNDRRPGCLSPTGCLIGENIDLDDLEDAVRVECNNPECTFGNFMHKDCFGAWESHVLNYLRSTGRARSWSEKQRHQNLWTKKGYDLAYKACDCLCGRGHLCKDLNYVPAKPTDDEAKKKRHRKKSGAKQLPAIGKATGMNGPPNGPCNGISVSSNMDLFSPSSGARTIPGETGYNSNCSLSHATNNHLCRISGSHHAAFRMRARTLSLTSSTTSTSPPNNNNSGVNSGPHSFGGKTSTSISQTLSSKFDANALHQIQTHGSIFGRRDSLSKFLQVLPEWKVNGYHIKIEDDCPQGNDDTRCFILTNLGDKKVTRLPCIFCRAPLQVYDRYPLLDGTFFLSPANHANSGIQVKWEGEVRYLLALCIGCLARSGELMCQRCGKTGWFIGDSLQLGTMYSYDVLSAFRCACDPVCYRCCALPGGGYKAPLSPGGTFGFFTAESINGGCCDPPTTALACANCGGSERVFVKPLEQLVLPIATSMRA